MAGHPDQLLCELHAHSTWSDGALSIRQLADLYGVSGFDVLAVTDHVVRSDDPWLVEATQAVHHVHADNHAAYLAELEAEAERARELYGLLLLPGLELTYNDGDASGAAHAVAVGLRTFVSVDAGIGSALRTAREAGSALVAAHPYPLETSSRSSRTTALWAQQPEWARSMVDRFELVNRHEVFAWVAAAQLPVVASGDFHVPQHLSTWKTLLPCEPAEEAVVDYLRSGAPAALTRIESAFTTAALAA